MNIRELNFKEVSHGCLEAQAVWGQLHSGACYEVSPLVRENDEPYAWEASYYADNMRSNRVDPDTDEFPTKAEALRACQEHNRRLSTAMIEAMLS